MGRDEIVVDGQSRWVTAGYLDDDKPVVEAVAPQRPPGGSPELRPAPAAGLSTAPCPDGSVESGLTSSAVCVYRAVCHAFPQITSYGGWDAHGEHASGKAHRHHDQRQGAGRPDRGVPAGARLRAGLYDIIWWDQIWTPERASEGWRDYGDHGSATANHIDHVHVSTTS